MGSRREEAEATREALIEAALELFAERGYSQVGTEEIVSRARVTRGALYHHFEDKRDLFRAVHERVEEDFIGRVAAGMQASRSEDPWEVIAVGVRAVLDATDDPALRRIGLIDAPTVLGWREWREVEERYGLGLLQAALEGARRAGSLADAPIDSLAQLLLGALVEAAMMVTNAEDPVAARASAERALMALLDGLRA